MDQILLSTIIINYNGEAFIDECLNSLRKSNSANFEVIFFDNNSSDSSIQIVKKKIPFIKLICSPENLFFSAGNNLAAEHAQGKWLFFLNNDTRLDADCINEIIATITNEKDKNVGIYAPLIKDWQGLHTLELGMGMDKYVFPWQNLSNNPFYAEGSALIIKRELFEKLNGFDEKMIMIGEDVDLCWRARLHGWKIKTIPKAIVYHAGGATIGGAAIVSQKRKYQTSITKRYFGEQNQTRNILKNYSLFTLMWLLPLYFFWKSIEILLFLLCGKINIVKDVYLKALWWNATNFSDTMKARAIIQRDRTVTEKKIFQHITKGNAKLNMFLKIGIPKIQ